MVLNCTEISQITGRKSPLNLLDKVIKQNTDSLMAIANVTMSQSFFQGHFPKNPVMPGVLIIETMSQAAKILFIKENPNLKLSKIRKARFREMIKPGDQLIIKIMRKKTNTFSFQAEAYLGKKVGCTAELDFS